MPKKWVHEVRRDPEDSISLIAEEPLSDSLNPISYYLFIWKIATKVYVISYPKLNHMFAGFGWLF